MLVASRASRQAAVPIVAVCFLASQFPTVSYSEPDMPQAAQPTKPTSLDDLNARVAALKAEIYDPSVIFSRSAKLAELRMLVEDGKSRDNAKDAVRDSLLMIALVESKGGETKDVVAACREAFAIEGATPLPDERHARARHMCAEHLKDIGAFTEAATNYQLGIKSMKAAPVFTEDQRLGSGQDLGYVLHEAGDFQAALDNNLEVLAGGEKLHGRENPLLRSVVTNIAQNLHAMGRKPEAEPYLVRALAMARAEDELWYEQDLLFQLGVLAHETGNNDAARKHMQERIALLKSKDRPDLLEDAVADMQILDEKIAAQLKK
jgi:tetratricopeptide (TPR) repeat protein